jgi:hypothetical protein
MGYCFLLNNLSTDVDKTCDRPHFWRFFTNSSGHPVGQDADGLEKFFKKAFSAENKNDSHNCQTT